MRVLVKNDKGHSGGRAMQDQAEAVCTRIGLISNRPIRLTGLESVFENHPSICAVSGNLETLLPDLIVRLLILDLGDDFAWVEMQRTIRRIRPDIRQIVLGPGGNDELILRSISNGARGYLDTHSRPHVVRRAVEAVMQGSIWAPRRVLSRLVDRLLSQQAVSFPVVSPVFSPRERQVLDLILTARSNREIALELGIEERTVKAYVASLLRKTGAENRVSLSVHAMQESRRGQRSLLS